MGIGRGCEMKNIVNVIADFIEDILILAGLIVINYAAFQINEVAGLFTVGATLLLVGFTIARHPPKKE